MEDALDNEIEMDEVCHPERSAERGVEGSRAASAGESSEWAQLAACLHPGVSVRLPLSRIPSKSYAHVKRVFDITFSAGAVVILSPVLLACAVAVKATSPGPVLFRQERWGRAGERFECIKFRTMLVETPPDMPAQDFADKAAFMTPVGDFLRRWSLDELPQLANILKGDIPLRILKTRRGFSVKMLGAFALPARLARTRIAAFLQVRGAIYAIVGVPQNLFEYSIAGYGKMRGIFAKRDSRIEFPLLGRFMLVPCNGFPI